MPRPPRWLAALTGAQEPGLLPGIVDMNLAHQTPLRGPSGIIEAPRGVARPPKEVKAVADDGQRHARPGLRRVTAGLQHGPHVLAGVQDLSGTSTKDLHPYSHLHISWSLLLGFIEVIQALGAIPAPEDVEPMVVHG